MMQALKKNLPYILMAVFLMAGRQLKAQSDAADPSDTIIGLWFDPHDASNKIRFNYNGTWCKVHYYSTGKVVTKGTYTFSGKTGWLIYNDGVRFKFHYKASTHSLIVDYAKTIAFAKDKDEGYSCADK